MRKVRTSLNGLKWLITVLMATCSVPSLASPGANLAELSQLKIYGVQRASVNSVASASRMLEDTLADKGELTPEAESTLHQFLFYQALNQYVGFLLNITGQPDQAYLKQFSPLQTILQADFDPIHFDAIQQAAAVARRIKFDVSMIYEYSKNIYNASEGALISNELDGLLARLEKVSKQLDSLYPAGQGELPPSLVAFVNSVFTPFEQKVHASCPEHMPEQLKARAQDILASSGDSLVLPVLASPVKNTQSILKP